MKKLLLSLFVIVLILFSIAVLSSCKSIYDGNVRTIPGEWDAYYHYEVEGIDYYIIYGEVVCPARDRAIIEMSKNFNSVRLPYK